jgi:hypothetical protein
MPTQCSRDLFGFAPVEGRRVEAAFDGGDATSDARALLLGATDRAIGPVTRFASCFDDSRVQGQIEHTVATMVAQRVFGTRSATKISSTTISCATTRCWRRSLTNSGLSARAAPRLPARAR